MGSKLFKISSLFLSSRGFSRENQKFMGKAFLFHLQMLMYVTKSVENILKTPTSTISGCHHF